MTSRAGALMASGVVAALVQLVPAPPVAARVAQSAERTWSSVMYLGGAAGVRGKSLDWDNTLTISTERVVFAARDRKNPIRFEIPVSAVRKLDYTGHRHMNDDAAGAGLAAAGLIGLLAGSAFKSTDHYLLVEYTTSAGGTAAVLFRLHKDYQEAIIARLHEVTGIPRTS